MALLVNKSLFSDNPTLHNIDTGIAADVKDNNDKTVNTMVIKMYSVIFILRKKDIYNCNGLE